MTRICTLFTLLLFVVSAQAQFPANGSDNQYGYTFESFGDTDPRYSWVDIATPANEVFGLADDNFIGPFSMGFAFDYYWVQPTEFFIGSNGYISFTDGFNISSTAIGFPPTPNPDGNDNLLAPFMCDLSFSGAGNTGRCFVYTNNADSLVVTFQDVPFWTNNAAGFAGSNTFQVILNAADSSIKYQYLTQQGSWNSSYDQTPNPMVTGWESVSAVDGALISNNNKPVPMTGVVINPPATPGIEVRDITPIAIQNDASAGFFVATPTLGPLLTATIGNRGSTDADSLTTVTARILRPNGSTVFTDQLTVGPLVAQQETTISFPTRFRPPANGSYSYEVSVSTPGTNQDINPSNDTRTVEAVAVDTTGGSVELDFVTDVNENITDLAQWTAGGGNSGIGVYIVPPAYPALIEAVEVFPVNLGFTVNPDGSPTDSLANDGIRVSVYNEDPFGTQIPGPVIYEEIIPQDSIEFDRFELPYIAFQNDPVGFGGWNRVELPVPVRIDSGGFYIGWFHLGDSIALAGESVNGNAGPISRRNFEILSGTWAPHRNLATEEYYIRAIMDLSQTIPDTSLQVKVSLSPSMVVLGDSSSVGALSVTANVPWTVSSPAPWLNAFPSSGSGDGTLQLFSTDNPDSLSRTATVTITGEGGSSTAFATVEQLGKPTSIARDFSALESITLYPNPVTDRLNVQVGMNRNLPLNLSIYSLQGRKLRLAFARGQQVSHQFDLSDLPAGTYLLRITSPEGEVTRQIIKQ